MPKCLNCQSGWTCPECTKELTSTIIKLREGILALTNLFKYAAAAIPSILVMNKIKDRLTEIAKDLKDA